MSRLEDYYEMTNETKPLTSLLMVRQFHNMFNHPIADKPNIGSDKENQLRVSLIQEELDELKEALANRDITKTADALADLQYVLDGAFLALGYHRYKEMLLLEVHRSNMSKLGVDGKPEYHENGKVKKGPNFKEPDLTPILSYFD